MSFTSRIFTDKLIRPVMPELDSLRGIAILLVSFFHGSNYPGLAWSEFKGPARLFLTASVGRLDRGEPLLCSLLFSPDFSSPAFWSTASRSPTTIAVSTSAGRLASSKRPPDPMAIAEGRTLEQRTA
jgi:hypothetical protein